MEAIQHSDENNQTEDKCHDKAHNCIVRRGKVRGSERDSDKKRGILKGEVECIGHGIAEICSHKVPHLDFCLTQENLQKGEKKEKK